MSAARAAEPEAGCGRSRRVAGGRGWFGGALALLAAAQAAASGSLPELPAGRELDFRTQTVTWMAHDVSPDGRSLVFDALGDIYRLDIGGGNARPVLTGVAYEGSPVFSPDGDRIAFISDRSGSNNLWVAKRDGSAPMQLSFDTGVEFFASPEWSADGGSVFVSRSLPALLAFELFQYHLDGSEPVKVVSAQPAGHEGFDARRNALDVAVSPEGRFLYYSTKTGTTWPSNVTPPTWSIVRHDLVTGKGTPFIDLPGGAMKPVVSADGRYLAYATRHSGRTGLRLRDLQTTEDRWLAWPVDPDGQNGGYYAGLLPGYRFIPDKDALLVAVDGGLQRVTFDGQRSPVPFQVRIRLDIGPDLRFGIEEESGPVRARVLQAPALSPDGRWLAFAALGGLYVHDLEADQPPRRIAAAGPHAQHPAWSPDGRELAYVTWAPDAGGHVWRLALDGGGPPRRLSAGAAYYSEPTFLGDGQSVAVLRSSHHLRVSASTEVSRSLPTDIVRLEPEGQPVVLTHAQGARSLQLDAAGRNLTFYSSAGLATVPVAGGETIANFGIRVRSPSQYVGAPVAVSDAKLSPRGDKALAHAGSHLYLVDVPAAEDGDDPPSVDLTGPGPGWVRLTRTGADAFQWVDGGRAIAWMAGSTLRRLALAELDPGAETGAAEQLAEQHEVVVEVPRDVPAGAMLLRGATAITMRGDEVIEDADVLVVGNRIAAIGPWGTVEVPDDASVLDLRGRYLLPGFVDTHAHWARIRRSILDPQPWEFLANLAYGVTSGLDVQPFTVDVLAYQDMIDAGLMLGPRAYSTGPGIFVNSAINTADDAAHVLARYTDHYRTRNSKAYMIGNRAQRRAFVEAAHAAQVVPTTEGASDLRLNLTHVIDGFAGNEHSLPVSPLHDDVITLLARSGVGYTPTFQVLYGGQPALDEMVITHEPQHDEKLRRFMPADILQAKAGHQRWSPHRDQDYPRFAADALAVQRAGGRVGMGSHGELQGIGYHWELQAYAAGGATPYEVLQAATLGSADIIGRSAELGSLEPGKLADLLVLERNPLEDIRHTLTLDSVMKNGRLYDAGTLDQTWPEQRPLPRQWYLQAMPPGAAQP